MKLYVAAMSAVILAGSSSSAMAAPTLRLDPTKPCYRDGERVNLLGAGFSANSIVSIDRDGVPFDTTLSTGSVGTFEGELALAQGTKQATRTYTATDSADPSLVASATLTVSAVEVHITPDTGAAGKLLRIDARGFTDEDNGAPATLYAHVVRAGRSRDVRVGRLEGACGTIVAQRRLFSNGATTGSYRVQFDAFRSYRRSRAVKYGFTVHVTGSSRAQCRDVGPPQSDVGLYRIVAQNRSGNASCKYTRRVLRSWYYDASAPDSGPRGWRCRTHRTGRYSYRTRCTRKSYVIGFTQFTA